MGRVKVPKPLTAIQIAHQKSNDDFIRDYVRPSDDWLQWTHPRTGHIYTLSLTQPQDLSREELNDCLNLIELTSGDAYRSSSIGWHVRRKKAEMQAPELRYIRILDAEGVMKGFTSMMPTFENGEPVLYCFEIHLMPELQGRLINGIYAHHNFAIADGENRTGLGSRLMGYLLDVAENIPDVEKVMLTCFTSNTAALRFYEKLGFDKDAFSPEERELRGGKVFKPDYVILSRRTADGRRVAGLPDEGDAK